MSTTYSGTYYTPSGRFYPATVFLSAVTITLRYRDENNEEKDVYWLTKQLVGFNEVAMSSELQYRNNNGETERLSIRDAALVQALKRTLGHHRIFGQPHKRVLGSIWTKLLMIFLIVVAMLVSTYIWLVPWQGERMANGFSKENEIAMGEQLYKSTILQYKVDDNKTAILNNFYKELHYDIGYPIQITVVESNVPNAFAMPGGHIVVQSAILDEMKTPEQLAALLGHEGSHIALRHSLRNIFRSLSRKMFISLIVGSESGIAAVVANNADMLKGLEYSRSLETEADNNGLQLMTKNNINPQGMVRLMQMLQQQTGSEEPASFLSTHPVFKDRITNIENQIGQLPQVTTTANDNLKKLFHEIYE